MNFSRTGRTRDDAVIAMVSLGKVGDVEALHDGTFRIVKDGTETVCQRFVGVRELTTLADTYIPDEAVVFRNSFLEQAALALLGRRDAIAQASFTRNGRPVVLEIVRGGAAYVLRYDEGGVTTHGDAFDSGADLAAVLETLNAGDVDADCPGLTEARHVLLTSFVGGCSKRDEAFVASLDTTACPNCGKEWRSQAADRVVIATPDGEAERVACAWCMRAFFCTR